MANFVQKIMYYNHKYNKKMLDNKKNGKSLPKSKKKNWGSLFWMQQKGTLKSELSNAEKARGQVEEGGGIKGHIGWLFFYLIRRRRCWENHKTLGVEGPKWSWERGKRGVKMRKRYPLASHY